MKDTKRNIAECPFCHKTKTKTVSKEDGGIPRYDGKIWVKRYKVYVTCNICRARGPIVSVPLPYVHGNQQDIDWDAVNAEKDRVENEAVTKWNAASAQKR